MTDMQDLVHTKYLPYMIEAVPHGMIMVDQSGHIVMANRPTEDIFGYRRDELLGRPMAMLIAERAQSSHPVVQGQYFDCPVTELMGVGRDLFARRKDGSEVPVEIGLKPLKTSDGTFILSEIVEITSRKQLEAKILRIKEIEAQESERRRLAGELHSELGQLLSAISLTLEEAKQICGPSSVQLDDIIRRTSQAIEHVRNLSFDLRPPMLDELGLISTLRWYADRQLQRASLDLHFFAQPSGVQLPPELTTTCYRVLQESLANVIQHAHARQVWIELHETPEEVRLSVRDDGIGFDSTAPPQRVGGKAGGGLLGIKERVEILDGQIEIRSVPTQGTFIEARIPVKSASSAEPL